MDFNEKPDTSTKRDMKAKGLNSLPIIAFRVDKPRL